MLNKEEKQQYNRHLILNEIGEEGQQKLKQAKVLVIGAGGLGCPILQYLAAAGVGTIGIVDFDVVDQSNLQRQVLFTHDDIGKPKAEAATRRLSQLNPFVTFHTYVEALSTSNAINLFERYDIVVDGCDNFATRYLVNDAAVLTSTPVVFGSIFKFEGQVSVFNYNNGPTYRCLYPNPPKTNDVPNCSEIGVLGVLPGIIGCLQANEVIKIICGIGEVLSGKLLSFNALNMQQLLFNFKKNDAIVINELLEDYQFFCGETSVKTISYENIKDKLEDYFLLDVRTFEERQKHHIGGLHIPLDELEKRYSEIKTNKPIVIYCKSGVRSAKAVKVLELNNRENELFSLIDL